MYQELQNFNYFLADNTSNEERNKQTKKVSPLVIDKSSNFIVCKLSGNHTY